MSYKILLADDNVTVQKIITLTFSDEGVDVMTVNNGDEAIKQLPQARPALVIADVSIPGKNGYDICEFVRNHPDLEDTPVILLVPAFEPFDEARARQVGADQHLTKPFQSIRTLIATVKALLESRVQRRTADLFKQTTLASALTAPPTETGLLDDSFIDDETAPPVAVAAAANGDLLAVEPKQAKTALKPVAMNLTPTSAPFAVDDADDVLDLRDVLPSIWAIPTAASQAAAFATASAEMRAPMSKAKDTGDVPPALASVSADSAQTVPPAVIDEIVERVTAQLSIQLIEELSEKLSRDLARRLAPAVAELVKQPQFGSRAASREKDSLLDLDEF